MAARTRVIVANEANEAQVKGRTVAPIKRGRSGMEPTPRALELSRQIDGSLKPGLVATRLLVLKEGADGRVVFEPGFKPRAPGEAADDHSAEVDAAAGIAMPG